MRPGAVPVTLDGLGVEADVDPELLGDALEQPSREPELVADLDRAEYADLELPLAHHDFRVRTFDTEAGAHAGQRVRLDDVATGHLRAPDTAVVRALRRGEALLGPSVGSTVLKERVLLFDTEFRFETRELRGDGGRGGALVGDVRCHIGVQHFAHHQYVIGTT